MSLDQDISISCNGYSAGAAEYAWWPSPPPLPPSSPTLWARRGEDDAPHLPSSPPAAPTLREGKGDERSRGDSGPASVNDATSTTQTTPLPRCGRGTGGEGGPHLPPPLPRCGRGGGERRDRSESILAISQMVAQARYMLDKKSGCLIRL
jgi:hypothetical protein